MFESKEQVDPVRKSAARPVTMGDDELLGLACKFPSRSKMKAWWSALYRQVSRRGLLDSVVVRRDAATTVESRPKSKGGKWSRKTDQELIEFASQFRNRREFSVGNRGAMHECRCRGLLDEIMPSTQHRTKYGDKTREEIVELIRPWVDGGLKEFRFGDPGLYAAAEKHGLIDMVANRGRNPCRDWSDNELSAEAAKYSKGNDLKEANSGVYTEMHRRGIQHLIPRGKKMSGYTRDDCESAARATESRHQWHKHCPGSYRLAQAEGWLDELMPLQRRQAPWGFDELMEHVKDYKGRKEFASKNRPAYNQAVANGWLDDLMPSRAPKTRDSVYLWRLAEYPESGGRTCWKIGYSAWHLGRNRPEAVSADSGYSIAELFVWQVDVDAYDLEQEMLMFGEPAQLVNFDGCTETRLLTPQEVQEVKWLAEDSAVDSYTEVGRDVGLENAS